MSENLKSSRFAHRRMRYVRERIIESLLFLAAFSSVAITVAIVVILVRESLGFFEHVSIIDFLTDTQWTPLFTQKHYGILPLLTGTMLTTLIAVSTAMPIGLTIAIYLSEYANKNFRKRIKPLMEILAAVPTPSART